MSANFQLSCESTVDFPYAYMAKRNIPILFYTYTLNEEEYEDNMLRDPEALPNFFSRLKAGEKPSTSQINFSRYLTFLKTFSKRATCCTSLLAPV